MNAKKSIGGLVRKPDSTRIAYSLKIGSIVLLLLVFALFAASAQDRPRDRRNPATAPTDAPFSFTIKNSTGFIARRIVIRRTSDNQWGDNVLRTPELRNGDTVTVYLDQAPNGPYSIRMTDSDGDTYSKHNITITENGEIELVIQNLDVR